MAYIKRNPNGKIAEFALAAPIDEKTKSPVVGWEFISDSSAEFQDFLKNPPAPPPAPRWRDFRNTVELSPEWLAITTRSNRTLLLAVQLTSILWNAPDDTPGLTSRWRLLFQEAQVTPTLS